MTVLQVHWYSTPHVGGIETHLEAIAPEFEAMGVTAVTLSGTPESRGMPGVLYDRALDLHAPPAAVQGVRERLRALLPSPRLVHLHNLHAQDPGRGLALTAAMRAAWPAAPIMITVHNIGPAEAAAPVLQACDAVYVPSPFIGSIVTRSHGIPTRELTYSFPIPRAVDPGPPRPDGPLVVQPTRFTWWKGSFHALAATIRLLEDGARFVFLHAGASWHDAAARWDSRADDLLPGLRDAVQRWVERGAIRFVRMTSEDTAGLIATADVVVYPTVGIGDAGEPFGVAAWQAAAAGRPLVLTTSGHLEVLASRYDASRVVEIASVDSLTAALRDGVEGRLRAPSSGALATEIEDTVRGCAASHLGEYARLSPAVVPR